MKHFPEILQDIYQRLAIEPEDLGMSSDEIYAYVKKFNLNRDSLYSFIKDKLAEPKKKEEKAGFNEADYLELIKLSRNPEYSDSMVYYKGKVLGRCPAGTTKVGRSCAPSQKDMGPVTKYKKNALGGLSRKQIEKLAKAKNTEQVMDAHKEQEQEEESKTNND